MHWGSQGDSSWITHSASVRGMYHVNNKLQSPALAPLPWNTPLPTLSENKSKTLLQKRCLQKASHGHTNEYKKGRPWRLISYTWQWLMGIRWGNLQRGSTSRVNSTQCPNFLVLNVPYQNIDTGKGGEERRRIHKKTYRNTKGRSTGRDNMPRLHIWLDSTMPFTHCHIEGTLVLQKRKGTLDWG